MARVEWPTWADAKALEDRDRFSIEVARRSLDEDTKKHESGHASKRSLVIIFCDTWQVGRRSTALDKGATITTVGFNVKPTHRESARSARTNTGDPPLHT